MKVFSNNMNGNYQIGIELDTGVIFTIQGSNKDNPNTIARRLKELASNINHYMDVIDRKETLFRCPRCCSTFYEVVKIGDMVRCHHPICNHQFIYEDGIHNE